MLSPSNPIYFFTCCSLFCLHSFCFVFFLLFLQTILSRRKGIMFSAKDVCWIGLEIAKGIEFLHTQKNPIIHRDLKVFP